MFARKFITNQSTMFFGTSALTLAAAPLIKSQEEVNASDSAKSETLCRPSELPIYPPQISTVTKVKTKEPSELEKMLIGPVSVVRVNVVGMLRQGKELTSTAADKISETAENFNFIVAYLREEENEPQRIGAVAMGTLTGLIFGLRGGIIKKLTYGLLGTGAMGAICFPEQTNKYANEGIQQGKLLTRIAYNFVYGVKPGDPQPEINFPEITIPKSFNEFVGMGVDLGKSIKDAVMPSSAPALDTKSSESNTKE